MERATNGTYGAPFVDAETVRNPTSQLAASRFNRMADDVAQMTRVSPRGWARVVTYSAGATKTYAAGEVTAEMAWGNSDALKPVVTKTANGRYTFTFPTTYVDGNTPSTTESTAISFAEVSLMFDPTTSNGFATLESISSNVVKVCVWTTAAAPAVLGDHAAAATIQLQVR